jgi:hypothetical protein
VGQPVDLRPAEVENQLLTSRHSLCEPGQPGHGGLGWVAVGPVAARRALGGEPTFDVVREQLTETVIGRPLLLPIRRSRLYSATELLGALRQVRPVTGVRLPST